MGETGSVGFMFDYFGFLEYPADRVLEDAMLDAAIEAGAENCETSEGVHSITTTLESFASVRDGLAKKFGDAASSKFAWVPKTPMQVADDAAETLMELIEALEDHDDVQDVFTNAEFSAAAMESLSA
jgi:transcriptional/translational regulatory protein YebC/TACO1